MVYITHLTSLKIDDDDYNFCKKYGYKFQEIFKIGIANAKLEHLETLYEKQAELRKEIYTIDQKIYTLESESIYKTEKVYTLDDVKKDFIKGNRIIRSEKENLIWLENKIKKLRSTGLAHTPEQVLEYCNKD